MKGWIKEKELKTYINNFLATSLGPTKEREEAIKFYIESICQSGSRTIEWNLLTKAEVPIAAPPGIWEGEERQKNVDLTRRKFL